MRERAGGFPILADNYGWKTSVASPSLQRWPLGPAFSRSFVSNKLPYTVPAASAATPKAAIPRAGGAFRVWLVDDQDAFRELLVEYLTTLPRVKVVGNSRDDRLLRPALDAGAVDLVILDLMLEESGGLTILRELGARPASPAVLILSSTATAHAVFAAAQLGVSGFVQKSDPLTTLGLAVQRIAEGGVFFSEGPRRLLGESVLRRWARLDTDEVNRREVSLLVALLNEQPIKEVAEQLHLSVWSTYKLRAELMKKANAHDNRDLMRYATRIGLAGTKDLQ